MWMPKVIINGSGSYECVPGKGCQKHQRHFQAHSTSLLFRMFCKGNAALAPIVTEYIYRKMRPFFAAKPTLRWEVISDRCSPSTNIYICLLLLLKTCIVIFLCPISVKFQDTYFSDGNIHVYFQQYLCAFFYAPVYKILLCPISGKIIFYFSKQMVRLYGTWGLWEVVRHSFSYCCSNSQGGLHLSVCFLWYLPHTRLFVDILAYGASSMSWEPTIPQLFV